MSPTQYIDPEEFLRRVSRKSHLLEKRRSSDRTAYRSVAPTELYAPKRKRASSET